MACVDPLSLSLLGWHTEKKMVNLSPGWFPLKKGSNMYNEYVVQFWYKYVSLVY